METIYIVEVWYFNYNDDAANREQVHKIFINENDAKGYCKLMNEGENRWYYNYLEYKICTKSYSRFA